MDKSRFFYVLVAVAVMAVAALTAQGAIATNAPLTADQSDAAVDALHARRAFARTVDNSYDMLDALHAQRVAGSGAIDTSDYFLRHPEGVVAFAGAGAVADAGGEKGHSFEVTFTKWISSPPNMIGVVGGDVGPGTFAGEIKSMTDDATKSFTTVEAVYHISGREHSFSANIEAVQNNTAGTGVITGEITEGWLKGRALSGEYRVLLECNMVTEPNANGKLCFQGTLSIPAAP
jgi:hypothetical protein